MKSKTQTNILCLLLLFAIVFIVFLFQNIVHQKGFTFHFNSIHLNCVKGFFLLLSKVGQHILTFAVTKFHAGGLEVLLHIYRDFINDY